MTKDEKNAGEIFAFISDATLIENYDCVPFAEQSLERRRFELIEGRLISTRFPTMCVKNLQTPVIKGGLHVFLSLQKDITALLQITAVSSCIQIISRHP